MITITSHLSVSNRSSAREMGHIVGSFKRTIECETDVHMMLLNACPDNL
jgi:hypothetical protein